VRFRTATALSVVLIAAMLALPRIAGHLARWYVTQGVNTIPYFQRPFFEMAMFFGVWWWALAPLTVAILFTIAIFTNQLRPRH
jgi:hypothetical protein